MTRATVPHRISLFSGPASAAETAAQIASLAAQFPDAEIELCKVESLEQSGPAALATPAAKLEFEGRTAVWFTGYLDDPTAVGRALQRLLAQEASTS